jgi:tetratricopeptide (TPR) repeat protein
MTELTPEHSIEEGMKLHRQGRLKEADQIYRQILRDRPGFPPALHLLGVIATQIGNLPAAVDLIRKALVGDPNQAEYWGNLGTTYRRLGNLDQAIPCFHNALALQPNFSHALNNLGVALRDKGMYAEAVAAFKKALAANPGFWEAQSNLGGTYHLMGRYSDAIDVLRQAIAINPQEPSIHNNLAVNLRILGKPEQAMPLLQESIRLDPNYADGHNTLAAALMDAGEYDEAERHALRAIELNPQLPEAYGNLGALYKITGRFEEALEANRKALAVNPQFAGAYWNMSLIHLLRGNFVEGWPLYEWRLKVPQLNSPSYPFARWDGSDLRGKRILLVVEQGLGDTIQFIRYLPRVAAMGAKIYLGVQNELVELLKGPCKVEKFILHGETCPASDFHISILSLPFIFKTDLDSIPNVVPYLNPPSELARQWKRKMPPADNRLRVGLVWAGRPTHRNDRERSLKLSQFLPLASDDVLFCSLQKGDAGQQAKTPPPGMQILDFTAELRNFADTAALIAHLDLVIAVDTAVAHLAGAMGKPVWLLLTKVPDFRWMLDREDSPWYPTMRLFRQKSAGDWAETIGRVAEALRETAQKRAAEKR